jgi:aspartate 1-decarboxylase
VDVLNITNGERGAGSITLNGAAARKVAVGDLVIIASYASMDLEEAKSFKPAIIFPGKNNTLRNKSI